jgi:ribosomal protein L37E
MGRMKQDHLAEEERRRRATVLGELRQEQVDIFCWCNRCGHNAIMPAGVLIAQLGPDFPVPDVGAHLRCSACGSKDIAARPAWPSLGQVTRHHDIRKEPADAGEPSEERVRTATTAD